MTRMVSKASLVNLAGAAAIVLTCGAWGVANGMAQEPQAKETPPYDLKTAKTPRSDAAASVVQKGTAAVHGGPHVETNEATRVAAPPELAACSSGTATACRAIEAGMAGGLWSWKEGNVTAMDDWETQAARADASKMTLKFKPEPTRKLQGRPATPMTETVQRVLTACDNADVSACAAFAASVQPAAAARDGRTYTAGR